MISVELCWFSKMATKFCFMLLFLSVCVGSSIAYDFFVLAQQWPPSLCNVGKRCVPPIKKDFTIHGLWPNLDNGTLLKECTNTSFDRTQITSIRNRLIAEWPNVYNVRTSEQFWRHEWKKHGTCSESVFPRQSEYFKLAFIRNRFDLKAILNASNIVPGTNLRYNTSSIVDAVENATGTVVKVACNGNRTNPRSQLVEIRICLNHLATCFINCTSNMNNTCQNNVTFPS